MWASLRRSRAALWQLHPIRRRLTKPPLVLGAVSWGYRHVSDTTSSNDNRRDGAKPKAKSAAANARCNGDHATSSTNPQATGRGRRPANCPPATRKKHLYLVLHDTKYGFGIHKVDVDDANGGVPGDSGFGSLERLPETPVLRVDSHHIYDFGVLGSNIIGMGYGTRRSVYDDRGDGDTLTFDTKTATLAIMPDLPNGLRRHDVVVAVAVGNRLYVIENGSPVEFREYEDRFCMGGLHCLKLDEEADTNGGGGKDDKQRRSSGESCWSWFYMSESDYSSRRWRWSGHHHMLPLSAHGIRAHALHQGGRAFFVSVCCFFVHDHRGQGTFSYNTERDRWTRHGDWELPFVGEAHYDSGLRAWVGLHGDERYNPDGYLCSCAVPRLGGRTEPDWKLGKERLFLEDPERHIGAKLVRMGGDGRFCLVEILACEVVDREGCGGREECKCVLRLTTFRVKYGDDGELTTTARGPTRSYLLPEFWRYFRWQAFWV